jgi:ribose transport system permease protein
MTVMLVVGGIDLSVGSVMCFAGVLTGQLFLMGMDPWLASILVLIVMAGVGAIMGFFVTKIGLSFFITSLAIMGIMRGACYVVTKGTPMSLYTLPDAYKFIGQGTVFGIPFVIILFLIIVIISDFLLRRSSILRKVYYVGSNELSARFSGINVKLIRMSVSIFCAFLTGLAGIIYMARFAAATPSFGIGLELTAISAAVIGGASLNGGEGTVLGAILGIALLSIITSSMILLEVSPYWQDLIKGIILILAVSIDHIQHTRIKK